MSSSVAEFNGFSDQTFRFLRELAENNNRPWFERNRETFQVHVLEPARRLVIVLGRRLEEIAPTVRAVPREKGSIRPIARDIRGSADKRPFRPHLDLWFWQGEEDRNWDCPGFLFRLTADALILGAGIHTFDERSLAAYREAIVAPPEGEALTLALWKVEQAGPYELGGASFDTVPMGYDPDQERAGLLRRKGLYAFIEGPIPHNIYTRRFIDYCFGHYKNLAPLHEWLVKMTLRSERLDP